MTTAALRRRLLTFLYGDGADAVGRDVDALLDEHGLQKSERGGWSERDAWLITYADQFQQPGETPLQTLGAFFDRHLASWLNGAHILPLFPWSSDDGFSVVDYLAVDPVNGTWDDVESLARRHRLGLDAVLNHMSAESDWFAGFLAGEPEYVDFFHTRVEGGDYSSVVRPRTSPLFTEFSSHRGPVDVWTTFSADQVDLNFVNPRVLLAGLDVLLTYARRGAAFIRLDAIGLLWKEVGTTCMHLPETHAVIQLWRACLDETYPDVLLLTETNVPHAENISYFGDGAVPEAQMVYQFPLAPLVLDAFRTGDATALNEWASSLELTVPGTTYFNFLASHDGIGVRPLEGIADPDAVDGLAALTIAAGGQVSYRTGPDGADIPYELNSTWFDLMAAGFDADAAVQRHLGSHAIQLALRGIPGIYVHSLFGSPNDQALFAETGRARSLNRHKFTEPPDVGGRVFGGMREMVGRRVTDQAFHPDAPQRILDLPPGLFGVDRVPADIAPARVVVNLTGEEIEYDIGGHREVARPFETIWR